MKWMTPPQQQFSVKSNRCLIAALGYSMMMTGCTSQAPSPQNSFSPAAVSVEASAMNSVTDLSPSSDQGTVMTEKLKLSEAEWKQKLSADQYHVLREKGTERPFTNEYDEHFEPGAYACAACGTVLFESETKFHSGCGWPAFYAAKAGDRVQLHPDLSLGRVRTEVTCAHCDSHLGHIFDDAPQTPTGQRYCINSVSLKFIPEKK